MNTNKLQQAVIALLEDLDSIREGAQHDTAESFLVAGHISKSTIQALYDVMVGGNWLTPSEAGLCRKFFEDTKEDSADGYYLSKPTGNVYKLVRRGTDDEGEHIELQRVAYVHEGKAHLTGNADHVVISHITMEWLQSNKSMEAYVPDWAGK